jgi:hypothetical protein
MAQQGRPKGGASKKLPRDRVTAALVPDPSQSPPDAVVLHGWVGNSTDPNLLRLYLSHDMRTFVDVPEAEVLHSRQLPDDQGTLIWLPRTLSLTHQSTQSAEVQAQFLSGSIAGAHLPSAGPTDIASQLPHVQPTPPYTILYCHTHVHMCPTPLLTCPVTLPFCPTEACQPSRLIICPTPSAVYLCMHTQVGPCPTAPYICYHSQVTCPSRICPSTTIPCHSAPMCPSALGCPSGIACFGPGGNLGGGE